MDDQQAKRAAAGSPMWMVTFADLMAILMCFFVLLLSFSELDVQKYKQVAGSMAKAFGVQRQIVSDDPPMGTSFVAREFSPGRPDPKPIQIIMNQSLPVVPTVQRASPTKNPVAEMVERLRDGLENEIARGLIDVETQPDHVIIRIREHGSFPSASAELLRPFRPVMAKIGTLLEDADARIIVAGHTDSLPISTGRFRSNWELSSARAATVLHELLTTTTIAGDRFVLEGHGDVRPIAPNDTAENRALNRRVELLIEHDPQWQGQPTNEVAAPTRGGTST